MSSAIMGISNWLEFSAQKNLLLRDSSVKCLLSGVLYHECGNDLIS